MQGQSILWLCKWITTRSPLPAPLRPRPCTAKTNPWRKRVWKSEIVHIKKKHKQELAYSKEYKPSLSWIGCSRCEYIHYETAHTSKDCGIGCSREKYRPGRTIEALKGFFWQPCSYLFSAQASYTSGNLARVEEESQDSQSCSTWTGSQPISFFHIPTCCWCWYPEKEFQKELAHCCPACKGDVYKLPRKFLDRSNGMRQVYEKCNISPEPHQVNDISLSLCTSVYHSVTVELSDVTLM